MFIDKKLHLEKIMKTCLETEVSEIKQEVFGLRSLLMELLDPDYGLELSLAIKQRIRNARAKGVFIKEQDILKALKA
jgi:hypothetical protein